MKLRFALSGSVVFETDIDILPPPGSEVVFRVSSYKKGFEAGTLVAAIVEDESPYFDFSNPNDPLVSLSVNNLREL
jgi:hypothetical protein